MGKHLYFRAFRKKLWISIFLLVASLTAISMITISVFLLEKLHDTMQQDFEEKGLILAREFSQRIAEELMIEDTIHLKKQLSQLFVKDELLYAVLYEGKGLHLLHRSTLEDDDRSFFLKGLKPELKTRRLSIGAETKIKTLDICVPIHYEKDIIGWLQLGISLERIDTEVKKRIINLSLFVIGLILFGLFASFIFARSLTKPINKLLIGVNRIGQGDLSYKVDLQRVDEIGALASAINNMSNELQQKTTSIDKLNQVIKEREEAEDHLKQSQKMEAIGTLAGGIAHEFNNVLGIILGNTELAMDDVPDWNPAKESLKEIHTASIRAKEVVRQILSFARKTMTSLKPIEINTILRECLKLMRASIPTMIEIQSSIPSEPQMILGDPTEIHQIVINLCNNAAHAMREKGGKLEVDLSLVSLDKDAVSRWEELKPGDFVKLTIKDSGEGMTSDVLKKVFEPYFTTKEFGEGTGMGLAVVYGLVKKCKGAIDVRSTLGEGTIVEVLFPKITEEAPSEMEIQKDLPMGNERILLVDDDKSIVRMVGQMLERLGYSVLKMTDSVAALEHFRSNPDEFDLVITDMAMPHMAGDQFAAELLKIKESVSILLCTGHSYTIDEDKAKQIGIKGFAMKPLDKGKLARSIRNILDS